MEYENIPKYENLYEVNRNGDINRILKSGARKPLIPRRDVNNQKFVTLCKKGEKKYTVSVRRVVFMTFADVDHSKKWDVYLKNKNKNDCSFDNLDWYESFRFTRQKYEDMSPCEKYAHDTKYIQYVYYDNGMEYYQFRRTIDFVVYTEKFNVDKVEDNLDYLKSKFKEWCENLPLD